MKKSFITVSPDSGQNDDVLNIVCDKTTLSTNRKEVLNVTGGGISKTLEVIQKELQVPTPIIRVGFDFTQSYYNTTINESSSFIDWTTNCLLSAVTTNETGEISVGNLKNFSDYIDIDNSLRIDSISINTDKTGIANIHNWTFNATQSSYDIKNDTLVLTQNVYYEIVEYIRTMLQTASGVFIIRIMSNQKLLELTIFIGYQA